MTLFIGSVETFQGADGKWRWAMVARNGEIVGPSQSYASKWSCRRTAKKLAKALGATLGNRV